MQSDLRFVLLFEQTDLSYLLKNVLLCEGSGISSTAIIELPERLMVKYHNHDN